MKKIWALLLAAALCFSLLTACGDGGKQPASSDPQPSQSQPAESKPVESEPVEPEPTVSSDPEPTAPAAEQDLADYLWEIPEDATLEEKARLELRNASLITAMELIFEPESYSAYSKAVVSLRSKKTEERLAKVEAARAGLVQETSVADGIFFLWKDFESMPIADGESYTEEQLDAASLLGYGYTTVLVKCLIDDPTQAKGNIVVCSGGAMKGRSNAAEGYPAVEVFNALGYNCFLLQRRVEPYSTMDIYMDYQRAVRVVRYYAAQEGWGGQDMIAGVGWSGGGATLLGAINHCYGSITPAAYDSDYIPDEIDAVSSDLDAALVIYGAYNADGGELLGTENKNLPAFYINHGTADSTIPYENSETLYNAVIAQSGTALLEKIEGAEHGYGMDNDWAGAADQFMQENLSVPYTVEEVSFTRDDLEIYGQLLLPEGNGPFPLVIMSHGYGGNYTQSLAFAQRLASNGVAAYAFDFNGGGNKSKSTGSTVDMSVLTEAADLNAVFDGLAARADIDTENIILYGASQGGFVSTYVATDRVAEVKALVLFFPAYVIHDDAAKLYPASETIPEEIRYMGMDIGRTYFADAQSFDIYDRIPNYTGDVLLFHGTKDKLVPISYSERAAQLFPSVEFVTVEGGAHGNLGAQYDDQALAFILSHVS